MTTHDTVHDNTVHDTVNTAQEHDHKLPGEGLYFTIFIVLALLTLTELLVTYLPFVKVPLLLALAVTKAWLVIQFYMHLRYDSKVFSLAILAPVAFAIVVTILIQPLATIVR